MALLIAPTKARIAVAASAITERTAAASTPPANPKPSTIFIPSRTEARFRKPATAWFRLSTPRSISSPGPLAMPRPLRFVESFFLVLRIGRGEPEQFVQVERGQGSHVGSRVNLRREQGSQPVVETHEIGRAHV